MKKHNVSIFLLSSLLLIGCQTTGSSTIENKDSSSIETTSTQTSSSREETSSVSSPILPQLSMPVITINEYGAGTWTEVDNASSYSFTINGLTLTTKIPCSVQLGPHSSLAVVALGDNITYSNSDTSTVTTNTLKLKTPVSQIDTEGTLTWSNIDHASSYQVIIWDEESSQENPKSTNTYQAPTSVSLGTGENASVRALGDTIDYTDSDDSNIVSCHKTGWDSYGKTAVNVIETILGDISALPFFQPGSNWTDFRLSYDNTIGACDTTFGSSLQEVTSYIDNTLIPDWTVNSTTLGEYLLTGVLYSYSNTYHATPEGNVRYYTFESDTLDAYFILCTYILNGQGHLKYYFSKDDSLSYLPAILPSGKAPVVNIDTDGTAHWNPIQDKLGYCFGYEVKINDGETFLQTETSYSLSPNDTIQVKLHGDNVFSSSNSPWSLTKTYQSNSQYDITKEELENNYSTSYFYQQLEKKENAKAYLSIYDGLAQSCYPIFAGTIDSITGKDSLIQATEEREAVYSYCDSDSSLTEDDIDMVYHGFKADHELYYFLDPDIYVEKDGTATTYYFLCGSEFEDVELRNNYRKYIFDSIQSYQDDLIANQSEEIDKTRAIHDQILEDIDFTYDDNGSPLSSVSAHSILGCFVTGEGVCESYARSFDLLMNFFGIETTYVYGIATYSGAGHAWDITKLGSSYYWFDPTWDDNLHDSWYLEESVKYQFFCNYDGQVMPDSGLTFAEQHYAYTTFDYPSISTTPYSAN